MKCQVQNMGIRTINITIITAHMHKDRRTDRYIHTHTLTHTHTHTKLPYRADSQASIIYFSDKHPETSFVNISMTISRDFLLLEIRVPYMLFPQK